MTDVLDPTPPSTVGRARELRHSRGWIFGTMLVSALLSLTASLVLSAEAITLAADPTSKLGCDINSVISCATVALSDQASLLGFPNAFLGLMAEPVVITIAVAALGGVRFPRWFMFSAQLVYLIGVIFAYWLFQQSLFEIGALCPWCMLVTVSTTLVFASLLHYNIREDNLYLPRGVQRWAKEFVDADNDVIVIVAWLILLAALIVLKHGAALFA
ncbi:vitamin K epoxide reductase family protein [Cellulomonas sp. 179-A 4D5 NHS]|uniref:vitamin K epoxide reductase family protein n=1 Tax=Cellulomonas sp. 179-A 4D5 NHS TaxID=3142378 RepID=UPI0039A139F3